MTGPENGEAERVSELKEPPMTVAQKRATRLKRTQSERVPELVAGAPSLVASSTKRILNNGASSPGIKRKNSPPQTNLKKTPPPIPPRQTSPDPKSVKPQTQGAKRAPLVHSMTFTAKDFDPSSRFLTGRESSNRQEAKKKEAVWDLFQSEVLFLIDHLMVLKHVSFFNDENLFG